MKKLRRRDVLAGAAALAACGGADMAQLPPRNPALEPRPLPAYAKDPAYHHMAVPPIHVSASALLQTGATQGVNDQALQNPSGQDMEVLEIKFEVAGEIDVVANEFGTAMGGSVACDFKLGNYKITNNAVPIWNFGRAENLSGENKTGGTGANFGYSVYSWRLPRPLFIPAGSILKPTFTHLGFVTGDLNVRVGYSARVAKAPKTICLPWVSAYMSKAFNPINVAGSDSSQPQQLMNDTDHVFQLQRFTGRLMFLQTSGVAAENSIPTLGARYLTARMTDSYGRPIVRTYTPFRSVFGDITRSWELEEVGAQLDPGAHYRVFLQKAAMTMASTALNATQVQAFIGMVGWREVAA